MSDVGGVDLEDSNISAYGSSEHRDLRKQAAESEDAYRGAGSKPGIEVWRIEAFNVVRWPKKQYGTFYQGDSYICLYTYQEEESKKLKYNVHFWLGEETSQDEYGTAAYKTVELDDLLGDVPVQYREVQGYESKEFKKLFPRMTILKGGVDSGFNEVKPTEYKARLLHVKGKADYVAVTQVALKASSLNEGDVFVLDNGLKLWQWTGPKSNHFERRKAMETINNIKEQRNGKPVHDNVDGLEDSPEFWELFGGKPSNVNAATPDTDIHPPCKHLFRLSDSSGKMRFTQEQKGEIKASSLVPDDVMLLDVGTCVYLWVGQGASKDERKQAMKYGMSYLQKEDRPMATPVVRVVQGGESKAFQDALIGPIPAPKRERTRFRGTSIEEKATEHKRPGHRGVLTITMLEAADLRDVQVMGKQDPYCVARVGNQKHCTPTHDNGNTVAQWTTDNSFTIALTEDDAVLRLVVRNDNLMMDADIGFVEEDLSRFIRPGGHTTDEWLPLTSKKGDPAGKVHVNVKYIAPLRVKINGARNIPKAQKIGTQDPYCILSLGKKQEFRTPVHDNGGATPEWKEGNVFKLDYAHDDELKTVNIKVRNKNLMKDDTICEAAIPVDTLKGQVRGTATWHPLQKPDGGGQAGEISLTIV